MSHEVEPPRFGEQEPVAPGAHVPFGTGPGQAPECGGPQPFASDDLYDSPPAYQPPSYPPQGYPQSGYPQQGYPPQGGYYGGPPQQGYMQQQQPPARHGLGAGGGAALGLAGPARGGAGSCPSGAADWAGFGRGFARGRDVSRVPATPGASGFAQVFVLMSSDTT